MEIVKCFVLIFLNLYVEADTNSTESKVESERKFIRAELKVRIFINIE